MSVPKKHHFPQHWLDTAKAEGVTSTLFGVPVSELTREELEAAFHHYVQLYLRLQEQETKRPL